MNVKAFLKDLESGKRYSLIVAPDFMVKHPRIYKKVFGYLIEAGVENIYPVGFGADITTWASIKYLKESGKTGLISPLCAIAVNYIEDHQPELCSRLLPVYNPMLCEAIYLKKYQQIPEELVLLSSCKIVRTEQLHETLKDIVKYNITFEELLEAIQGRYESSLEYDEIERYGLNCFSAYPGGLCELAKFFLGEVNVLQLRGEQTACAFFKDYESKLEDKPFLIDILNCQEGCAVQICEGGGRTLLGSTLSYEERWRFFNKRFSGLKAEDFMRNQAVKPCLEMRL